MAQLGELVGKLHVDIKFTKLRGCLGQARRQGSESLFSVWYAVFASHCKFVIRLRVCLVLSPHHSSGVATITDIFGRVSKRRGWDTDENAPPDLITTQVYEKQRWNDIIKQIHEPFKALSQAIDEGLLHAGICLEILPRPTASKKVADDLESRGADPRPGEMGFSRIIVEKVQAFHSRRAELLRVWTKERGLVADQGNNRSIDPESRREQQTTISSAGCMPFSMWRSSCRIPAMRCWTWWSTLRASSRMARCRRASSLHRLK